jgi:hypothetical protein
MLNQAHSGQKKEKKGTFSISNSCASRMFNKPFKQTKK